MNQQQHTQEPWRVAIGDDYHIEADGIPEKYPHHFKCDDLGKHVAIVGNRTCDFGEANARRIVACVNACEGIPNDMLAHVVAFGLSGHGKVSADLAEAKEQLRLKDKKIDHITEALITSDKQRDTLLAAVKLCVPELRSWMNCHGEDLQTIAAIKTSEAAIASVKEQA